MTENNYLENRKIARIAGFWYLILGITAAFSWMYITKIFVIDDAALTAKNILATESQYMLAIISNVVSQLSFVMLVFALYRLLKNVNKTYAKLMLILVLVSVPIMFVTVIFQTGALVILSRANYLNAFSAEQINAFSTMFVNLYIIGVRITQIFWGLWLLPLAYLIYKSNFFPKMIAYILVISGVSYLISSFFALTTPNLFMQIEQYLSIPESVGEVVMLLWLLIKGVRKEKIKIVT